MTGISGSSSPGVVTAHGRATQPISDPPIQQGLKFVSQYGTLGAGDDTATVAAALADLHTGDYLVFDARDYFIQNATIPNIGAVVDMSGATIFGLNAGDSDYLIANANYVNNYTGAAEAGLTLIRPTLDTRGFKTNALVWLAAQGTITKPNIKGAITTNLLLPTTTRNGSAVVANLVETRVESGLIEGDIYGNGTVATAYGVRNLLATGTDGHLLDCVIRNHATSNIYMQTVGGWRIEGNHTYNYSVAQPTSYDLDGRGVGAGTRIIGNHFESGFAMQLQNVSGTSDSVPIVQGNNFGTSPSGGGGKVQITGGSSAVVCMGGNIFNNACRLRLSGPGSGTNPLMVFLDGDVFVGSTMTDPFRYDVAPAIVHARNVRCQGHPAGKITDGWQTLATVASGLVYGTAAPVAGAWVVGDRCINTTPTVGQPKAWSCTVAGTPGTWVSEGNL